MASTAAAAPTPEPQFTLPLAELGPATMKQQRFIPLELIHPSPFNPRKEFDDAGIAELAESIRVNGLQQNLVVRPHPKKKEHYELMGGERRWRALKLLKAEGAICKVEEADDADSIALQLIENLQRQDVPPMEEAKAFVELQKADPKKWTPARIAAAIGMSKRFVLQRLALATSLVPTVRKLLEAGNITVEKARVLAGAPKHVQEELAEDWQLDEYSVEDLRGHILESLVPADRAAFDVALYKGGWHEEGDKRYFTDVEQFNKLQQNAAEQLVEKLRQDGWPSAALISDSDRYRYKWADTGDGLGWSDRKGTKATGKFKVAQAKCTAVVWIGRDAKVCRAEGVAPESAFPGARSSSYSSGHSSGPKAETAVHRRYRHAYNTAVCGAVAARPDTALRVLLMRCIDGTTRFTYDHGEAKKAHEAILPAAIVPFVNCSFDRGKLPKLWALVKAIKADDVTAMLAKYTVLSLTWSSTWDKKPPAFTDLIAREVKAKIPTSADVEKAHAAAKNVKAAQVVVDKGVAQIKRATKKKAAPMAKAKSKAKAKVKKKQ